MRMIRVNHREAAPGSNTAAYISSDVISVFCQRVDMLLLQLINMKAL